MTPSERSNVNPNLSGHRRVGQLSAGQYLAGIERGDRVVLSRAITLIESNQPAHRELAAEVIDKCLPLAGNSIRIAITGSPGVGKSTFIEALGQTVTDEGHRVAVLAVDPSSSISKGSILGDKTRMETLSANPKAFIRPSSSGNSLGGVAQKTRETILLCEAAGYGVVLVETVGVGQSEIAVHSMTDLFLLLILPGAGDELQGIKRGIVEMADVIAVNKADGERESLAVQTRRSYRNALHLALPKTSKWQPAITTCSALRNQGVREIWETIGRYREHTGKNGYFEDNRREQAAYWLRERIDQYLRERFYGHQQVQERSISIEKEVRAGRISPFQGAKILLDIFEKG